jgi:[NiFe] hydrogenase diaphorase moiety small subunit
VSGKKIIIIIDGQEVNARSDQTVLEAADGAGIYIPRLCFLKDLLPGGHCRLCTVKINGKATNACSMPAAEGMVIENDTPEINTARRLIVEMLFVEGNHFCPFCEKSGSCDLQALGYRLGMTAPTFPYLFPKREVDATHKHFYIDRNRCVLCGRCVRASRDRDKKGIFGFEGRGIDMRVAIDSLRGLYETDLDATDSAAEACPTGCIVKKHEGYRIPYGNRPYDRQPIGSDIEGKKTEKFRGDVADE